LNVDDGTALTPTTVLAHVLSNILEARDGSNYHRAFDKVGVTTITDFLEISTDEWSAVVFPVPVPTDEEPDATVMKSMSMIEVKKLSKLVLWYRHQQALNATVPVSYLAWYYDLTFESFGAFRDYQLAVAVSPPVTPVTPVTPPVNVASSLDAQRLAAFEKGRRRNINDFSKFTDPKNWGAWKRRMMANAYAQGVEDVFNPSFVPDEGTATALFAEKNNFVYAVFELVVQTSDGRLIVREHEQDRDAQAIYKKLVARHEDGTAALIATNATRELIMGLKLSEWRLPISAFLVKFQSLVLDLEILSATPVPNEMKRIWLETAVMGHAEMSAQIAHIRSTAFMLSQFGVNGVQIKTTYDNFLQTLTETATRIDSQTRVAATTQRRNHDTDRRGPGRGTPPSGRGNGGRGTPGRGGGRGFTGRGGGRGRGGATRPADYLTPEAYNRLTPEEKNALYERRAAARAGRTPPTEIAVNNHDTQSSVVTNPPAAPSGGAVHTTPPADNFIRALLSNNHAATRSVSIDDESIQINGRTYRADVHNIRYNLRNYNVSTKQGSLIDGGANGACSRVHGYSCRRDWTC
jgi:hypothetical protein